MTGRLPRRLRAARNRPAYGYLQVRESLVRPPRSPLTLGDLVVFDGPGRAVRRAKRVPWGRAPAAGDHRVIPALDLVGAVHRASPEVRWQVVSGCDAVVEGARAPRAADALLGVAAWLLLFIGAATTLLNFHADVNMPAAHRELYYLATGHHSARPLAVEIPYAIGVGLGALLFFSLPGKRVPGPLELEVEQYERRLRTYWRDRRVRRRRP